MSWLKIFDKNSNKLDEMSRVDRALYVRKNSINDFFGGWEEEDIVLLNKYMDSNPLQKSSIKKNLQPGYIYDWLGIRTSHKFHSWLNMTDNDVLQILDLPIPDDQIHAETIEYVGLTISIERAKKNKDRQFVMFEFGASYAPWAVASGFLAQKVGGGFFEKLSLNAVEASSSMIENAKSHAKDNGLYEFFNIIHGAVDVRDGLVYFPKVDVQSDNGAQISDKPIDIDYRGLKLEYNEIESFSASTLFNLHSRIDFLHMDLQGVEEKLLDDSDFLNTVTQKVSTIFLATHSRSIEGLALKNLSKLGWILNRERPTTFKQSFKTEDVNGWTLRDGGQIWINPKFS